MTGSESLAEAVGARVRDGSHRLRTPRWGRAEIPDALLRKPQVSRQYPPRQLISARFCWPVTEGWK